MGSGGKFPSMRATKLRAILKKELGYRVVPGRGKGGHLILVSEGRPQITWGFHNGVEIPPKDVRKVLVEQAGLSLEEAQKVVGIDG